MPNPHTATQTGLRQPNDKNQYEVTEDELPVHCPLPNTSLWNSHPRVYIAFDTHGRGKCPYCGAEFQLKN